MNELNLVVKVINKKSGGVTFGSLENMPDVTVPSLIKLNIPPYEIYRLDRDGKALIFKLKNGDVFSFANFFNVNEGRSDIRFYNKDGDVWWGEYTEGGNNFRFGDASSYQDTLEGGGGISNSGTGKLVAFLGLLAGGAALALSSGTSSGSYSRVNNPDLKNQMNDFDSLAKIDEVEDVIALSPSEITDIKPSEFSLLPGSVLAELSSDQLGALTGEQLAVLSKSETNALKNLVPEKIPELNPKAIAYVAGAELSEFSKDQLEALTDEQLQSMTQVELSNDEIFILFNEEQAPINKEPIDEPFKAEPKAFTNLAPGQTEALGPTASGEGGDEFTRLSNDYDGASSDSLLEAMAQADFMDDEAFGEFSVWLDEDSKGDIGVGDLTALEEAGTVSINLESDGIEHQTADSVKEAPCATIFLKNSGEMHPSDTAFTYSFTQSDLQDFTGVI